MLYRTLLLVIILFISTEAESKTVVNVGLTSVQPPFVVDECQCQGLVFDVINALNELQDEFEFKTKLYPTKRILANYKKAEIHIIAYNDVKWGWLQRGGTASVNLTNGRDLFVSLKGHEKYSGGSKDIAAVRGFHYAFAGFDTERLSNMKNVSLVDSEASVLKLVKHNRVHKGIVSETFLNWVSVQEPKLYEKLIIDIEKPDHTYNRQLVVFQYSPISLAYLNTLLNSLKADGKLQEIYNQYGLKVPAN